MQASAVLVAEEAARGDQEVQSVDVSVGLAWEDAERQIVRRLLESGPAICQRGRTMIAPSPVRTRT